VQRHGSKATAPVCRRELFSISSRISIDGRRLRGSLEAEGTHGIAGELQLGGRGHSDAEPAIAATFEEYLASRFLSFNSVIPYSCNSPFRRRSHT
jgi:hypothetical protein